MATKCIPKDLTDNGSQYFNNFVRQTVKRYKPHGEYYQITGETDNGYAITHWVIWNEPNHAFGNFWTDCKQATAIVKNSEGQDVNQYDVGYRPVGSIEDYAKLFKGGYSTIKQVAPGATVLMAGIAGIGPDDRHHKIASYQKFYDELNRIKSDKPDIWNAHIYQGNTKNFIWDLWHIVIKRNELDSNKEIWVTEYGFYRDFTPQRWGGQLNNISELFSRKEEYSINWNVKRLLYWTAKGYIMCDPDQAGCIPYTNIASCGNFPYVGCKEKPEDSVGKPYGELEMGTLLMSPNFYPDPVYLNYGEKMGTVTQVEDNIKTTVSNNRINVYIPANRFQDGKEYILIMSSPTKILTTKPWIVRVESPAPTATATPRPTNTPVPTATPTPSCANGPDGNLDCDAAGKINSSDLSIMLRSWSPSGPVPTPQPDQHPANLNGDSFVNEGDLIILLSHWSP